MKPPRKPKVHKRQPRKHLRKNPPKGLIGPGGISDPFAGLGLLRIANTFLSLFAPPMRFELPPVWYCKPCSITVTVYCPERPGQLYCPQRKSAMSVHGQIRREDGVIDVTAEPIIEPRLIEAPSTARKQEA